MPEEGVHRVSFQVSNRAGGHHELLLRRLSRGPRPASPNRAAHQPTWRPPRAPTRLEAADTEKMDQAALVRIACPVQILGAQPQVIALRRSARTSAVSVVDRSEVLVEQVHLRGLTPIGVVAIMAPLRGR